MKVYVVETGVYDAAGIHGIYSTLDKAMAAWPKGTWHQDHLDSWSNGLDWHDLGIITQYTLDP